MAGLTLQQVRGAASGAVVGGIVGGIIGAAAGWWGGTTLAEIVYDWVFTSLEKEEYVKQGNKLFL